MAAITPRELAPPLSIDATGAFTSLRNVGDIAAAHIRSIVGTAYGERVMRASYGSNVVSHLFGAATDNDLDILRTELSVSINQWAPEINVQSIDTSRVDSSVIVTIKYSVALLTQQSVTVALPVAQTQ